ncbi:MAG: transposase [Flavobacteriales bacterium]|nr:transposase [Flavobacteriales bacterium]
MKHKKQLGDLNRYVEGELKKSFDRFDKLHLRLLDKLIKEVDGMISEQVNKQPEPQRMYALLLSVPGVGPVLATGLLAITEGFTRFRSPRGCYPVMLERHPMNFPRGPIKGALNGFRQPFGAARHDDRGCPLGAAQPNSNRT